MEIVSALRAGLADRIGQTRYDVWFGPKTELSVCEGTLAVRVPNRFHQDWLRQHFRRDLEAVGRSVMGEPLAIRFEIDPALGASPRAAEPAKQPAAAPPEARVAATAPVGRAASVSSSRLRYASFAQFEVGPTNRLAYTSAQLAAERPGSTSPLFLYGPTGVGKTHLLESIWTAFRQARHPGAAVYLTAEQFTSMFLDALHGSGMPSFRHKVRGAGLLLLDDVQFFSGKRATLVELLHTVEALAREGRQLVLAADRAPAQLKSLGPELAARLSGGMACRLEPPDFATRRGIVRQMAARMQFEVGDDASDYVAAQFTAHARELAGALKRLQAAALADPRPLDIERVEEALDDLVRQSQRPVQLAEIELVVAETFGLSAESLQSGDKCQAVSQPRMLAMWLARKYTRAALSEIGRHFGRRSHTTVISATKKIDSLMSQGATVVLADRRWKLADAVRRVEQRLQTG